MVFCYCFGLTCVYQASDCSCFKAEIYINNYFLPLAHLSLQRARGSANVPLVSLSQKIEHWPSQQRYEVVPNTSHCERCRNVVRKVST